MNISRRHLNYILNKISKVTSDEPAYKEKKKTDKGYVWVYDDKHIEKRWKEKKEKLKRLNKSVEKLRKAYEKDLSSDDLRTRALAAIVGIMDDTAMRVGNEESVKESDTYGATTLKVKHLTIGNGKATFKFVGKDKVKQDVFTKNKKIISVLKELVKGKKGDDFIFEIDGTKIWDRAVNRYLTPFEISAKDIRGFQANKLMEEMLKKKDWKEALNEVAELVGHKASTLKNQYLDPDLVHKYDKKKEASLSIRADNEMSEAPEPVPAGSVPKVDINKNVNNIHPNAQSGMNARLWAAWRIMAPFLPTGARLRSSTRSEMGQKNIIKNYWANTIWKTSGGSRVPVTVNNGEGFFIKNFPQIANIDPSMPIEQISEEELEKARAFMTSQYDYRTKVNYEGKEVPVWKLGGPWTKLYIAGGGQSKHIAGKAIDIDNVPLIEIVRVTDFIRKDPLLSKYLVIGNVYQETDQGNVHVDVMGARPMHQEHLEGLLRSFYYNYPLTSLVSNQAYKPTLSKRALLSERDKQLINNLGLKPSLDIYKDDSVNADGLKTNELIDDVWSRLSPHIAPLGAKMTSAIRTPEDQAQVILNYWNRSGASKKYPYIRDPADMAKALRFMGYTINDPDKTPHSSGRSFDVSGPDLEGIAQKIKEVSDSGLVNLKVLIEPKNNAVHVDIVRASEAPLLSKLAAKVNMEKQIKDIFEDLTQSGAPPEVVEEYKNTFGLEQAAKDDEPKKYEREKDDPKWKKPLLKDWAREEIRNHYAKNADKILKEIKGQPVMLYIGTEKDKNILKRHHNDKPIIINNKEDLLYWADRRLLSIHRVFGPKTKLGFVDLDVHGDFSDAEVKKYAKDIASEIKSKYKVSPIIFDSGGSGYHIEFTMKQEKDTDTLRNELRELCEDLNEKYDGFTTGIVKGSGVRTDTTTLKDNGNIRVPYTLHESKGGVKKPIGAKKEGALSIRADEKPEVDIPEEQKQNDMGMGKDDMMGDWFEKSPMFRHKEMPEESAEITEAEAGKLANDEPEKFFYRGLHKQYPNLELEALKNMLKTNAKFYFVFKYNEREDAFKELLQPAAEALSQQDARAFFYYYLHQKFPELGRGAIIQIIDTNPDSFFDLGLDKDYPDYIESANNARNIKDPNKVELEQPEWLKNEPDQVLSIRDKNAAVMPIYMSDEISNQSKPLSSRDRKELTEEEAINLINGKHPSAYFTYSNIEPEKALIAAQNVADEEPIVYFMNGFHKHPLYKQFNTVAISSLINKRPEMYFNMHLFGEEEFKNFLGSAMTSLANKDPKFLLKLIELDKFKDFRNLKDIAENALKKRSNFLISLRAESFLSKRAKKKKHEKAGIFALVPKELAKEFPSLGDHDDSKPHITVLFIGKVPKKHEELLDKTIKEVLKDQKPFKVKLDDKVSYFPATKHSDWCKIAKLKIISDDLHKLNKNLKKAIKAAGIEVDDHFPTYKPHITLEYMPKGQEKYDKDFPKGSFTINKVEIWNGDYKKKFNFGKKSISKRAAKIDYPKKMFEEISQWINANSEDLKRKLFIIPGKKSVEQIFDLDISDTEQYAKHDWIPKMLALEHSNDLGNKVIVKLFKGGSSADGDYRKTNRFHEIRLFNAISAIKSGEIYITLKHELIHMMQQIMTDLLRYRNIFNHKDPYFGGRAGLPGYYNPMNYNMRIEPDEDILSEREIGKRHSLADVEFFTRLNDEIEYLKTVMSENKNEDKKLVLEHYIKNSKFFNILRQYDVEKYKKALREIYRAFGNITSIASKNPLSKYHKMRDFNGTKEPEGKVEKGKNKHRFVIQKHDADKAGLHFDLRLENDDGAMSSWAVPKHKLPADGEKLLATQTEDHPISYNKFKGEIEEGYGKGHVDIHDNGTYELIKWDKDTIKFKLKGKKEKGSYTLHKTDGKKWILMQMKEEE